jgi:hypothetical protein
MSVPDPLLVEAVSWIKSSLRKGLESELNVLGVHQAQPFANAALGQRLLHLRGDVHKAAPGGETEEKFFALGFHNLLLLNNLPSLKILLGSGELR